MDYEKKTTQNQKDTVAKRPYMRPDVIYSTEITTRAGSPLSLGEDGGASGVDPADLFGD